MKIDTTELEKDLKDPNKNQSEVIKNLVQSIEEIVESNKEMKRLAEEAAALSEKSINEQKMLTQAVIDYTAALRNIHVILGAGNPEEIEKLKTELSKWVLTSIIGDLKNEHRTAPKASSGTSGT